VARRLRTGLGGQWIEDGGEDWVNTRVERFEDLVAWQKARVLTRGVYRATGESGFARDWDLSHQLRRGSVSIMANIAEGFERGGRAEFQQFLCTAKASCAEVRSHLYVAWDAGYLDETTARQLLATAEEVVRITGGLRSAVERQRHSVLTPQPPQSSVLSPQSFAHA
jgi:four helix bundle protein